MRLLAATVLLGAAGTALAQSAQYIVIGLQNLQSNTRQLGALISSFQGTPILGVADVLQIVQQSDQVARAIRDCMHTADATPLMDSAGSEAVAAAILALRPDTEYALTLIQYSKPKFDQVFLDVVSVSKQIETNLQDQKALTAGLAYAITKKLSGAYRTAAPDLTNEFKDAFDEAIAEYVVADAIQIPALPIPPLIP